MLLKVSEELLKGFIQNIAIFAITVIVALPLGLIIMFGATSKYKIIKLLSKTFIWIIRGTPLMLQLYVVLYVPGLIFNITFRSRLVAALIAFIINYAAYFAEIYRGAVENIPKGQYEAGKVLGLSKWQIFRYIILFQIIKRSTAPVGNEIITLIKDTSLARVIAVPEILMQSTQFTAVGIIWPLFYTGIFYLAATAVISLVFKKIEGKMAYAAS